MPGRGDIVQQKTCPLSPQERAVGLLARHTAMQPRRIGWHSLGNIAGRHTGSFQRIAQENTVQHKCGSGIVQAECAADARNGDTSHQTGQIYGRGHRFSGFQCHRLFADTGHRQKVGCLLPVTYGLYQADIFPDKFVFGLHSGKCSFRNIGNHNHIADTG